MDTEERLREALLELAQLRAREQAIAREQAAVLDGLEKITSAPSPAAAVDALLTSVQSAIACDAVLLGEANGQKITISASSIRGLGIIGEKAVAFLTTRRRRVTDLSSIDGVDLTGHPEEAKFASLLSSPVAFAEGSTLILICLSTKQAHFQANDLKLLERMTSLAAQALRSIRLFERNSLLAEVIDGSSASISIADAGDPALPLIYVNEAFEIMSGYSRADALGTNCRFLSVEPPNSQERTRLRQAVKDQVPGVFEVRNKRADGVEFWNRLTLYPVQVGRDKRPYLVATQEDITHTREAQAERDAARTQLMSALAGTREGFLLLDEQGIIQVANARFRDFFETSSGQWTPGRSFVDAMTGRLAGLGQDRNSARKDARVRFDQLTAGNKDREELLPDGRILLVNDTAVPDGGFVSVATDITTIKATERRLAERMVAIDSAQDGVAITDGDGRFVYLNPSHVTMFGYDSALDLIGRSWTKLYRPEQAAFLQEEAMPVLLSEGRWRGDIPGIRRDGTEIMQDVSLTRLDGVGLICVTRDISDRLRGEAERAALRDQLAQSQRQEAIGQLAAGIAHDFNNVLAVIEGSAHLLEADAGDSAALAHVQRILSASEQAKNLVARMLDFGARVSEKQHTDLREPLGDAIALIKSGLPAQIHLSVQTPKDAIIAEVDTTDIIQVVLNLGINARDAMTSEGTLSISLRHAGSLPTEVPAIGRLDPDRAYALISIEDTGTGIPEQQLSTVFDAYLSTKGEDGTGLGLAVVASIVTGIDGALFVASNVGKGSRFDVYWPLRHVDLEQVPTTALAQPARLDGRPIIIVDDDGPVAEIMAAALERAGAETAICTDPRDAIEAIKDDPDHWALVITDFDMPVMNGADLAQKIQVACPSKAMILCTALPDWQGRSRVSADLFARVLQKPVDPDLLVATVSSCLDTSDSEADNGENSDR
ncbi:MAG: PAS domain S-box protein [Pseudomonadota bacterium]